MNYDNKTHMKYFDEYSDGFKFALTIIASAATILIVLISYLKKNPQPWEFAIVLFSVMVLCIILILSFLLYIFLKGLSFEAPSQSKDSITKIASKLYTVIYYCLTISFPLIVYLSLFAVLEDYFLKNTYIFIGFTAIIFVVVGYYIKKISPVKFPWWVPYIILGLSIVIWLVLTSFAMALFAYDNPIDVDAKEIYYYDDIISINLKINDGINNNISIFLMQESSNNTLQEIDKLYILYLEENNKTFHGYRMLGTSNHYGKFTVYINTENLTTGYYELIVSKELGFLYSKKGFYFISNKNNNNNNSVSVIDGVKLSN